MESRKFATRLCIRRGLAAASALLILTLAWVPRAAAYSQYTLNGGDATNCGTCHGDFRSGAYISLTDGQNWGNLHDLHRMQMLSGDCYTCHLLAGRFPVRLEESQGGSGLEPISCMGCHGRAEDNVPQNPEVAAGRSGYGAGLRQHHFTAGWTLCSSCHEDADPANYAAVGEDVLPVYYANPGNNHPEMPTDPCNADGSENFAGLPEGLDNDGDAVYDGSDSDCSSTGVEPGSATSWTAALLPNRPNPFAGRTSIEYEIGSAVHVQLRIVDVTGRLVRDLEASPAPGNHLVTWDGRNEDGRDMPSGLYFCELRSDGVRLRRVLVLIR